MLRRGKKDSHHVPSRTSQKFRFILVEIVLLIEEFVLHMFQVEAEVSCVKRARVLSPNQIRDIVMDSDSDEEKYYASSDTEDKEEPRPHSRHSPILQP